MAATTRALALAAWSLGAMLGAAEPQPTELTILAAKARLDGTILRWCLGTFEPGRRGAYAIAIKSSASGGQYLVIGLNETPIDVAPFAGSADLSCYSPAEAKRLHASIAASDTIHGGISPVWNTSVVCGFVEPTHAICWQYSPYARAFVKVGEWIT